MTVVQLSNIVLSLFVLHIFKVSLMYCFPSLLQMDPTSDQYIGFVDGASKWSPNLALNAWVIYPPSHKLIHIDGICMGSATNN